MLEGQDKNSGATTYLLGIGVATIQKSRRMHSETEAPLTARNCSGHWSRYKGQENRKKKKKISILIEFRF